MGQPVKLSDELVNEARIAGATMQRSIAGQVEFWARVGRAVEMVTSLTQTERLQKKVLPLSEIVRTVNEPEGRARLNAYLNSRPYPRYFAHPELEQTMIREDADGTKTVGRFKGRVFEPLASALPDPHVALRNEGLSVAMAVRDLRHVRNLSQRQLAGRMNVPRTYISKIENGKAMPTLSSLDRLARALQVDISALLRDTPHHHQDETAVLMPLSPEKEWVA